MKGYYYNSVLPAMCVLALLFACHASVKAQTTTNGLDSLVDRFNELAETDKNAFSLYADSVREAYDAYVKKAVAEFNTYKDNIQRIWGGDSAVVDSKYEWVEYGDDFLSRSVVNFEKGNALVEVAVDLDASSEEINEKLTEAIYRLMVSRGSTCPYSSQVDQSMPITQNPVMDGLLDLSEYHIDLEVESGVSPPKQATAKRGKTPPLPVVRGGDLDISKRETEPKHPQKGKTLARMKLDEQERQRKEKEAAEMREREMQDATNASKETIASQVAKRSVKSVANVTGRDGNKRKIVHIQMPLVRDNISKSAALYKDIVKKYSERFQIEQPLIYAVIEQESAFNPQATSHVPAYGLMQLVPTSGGLDAYQFVYGVAKIPTRSYLFVPDQNIELGTAYLRILYNMFERVRDMHCRRLCVIASYNTGAGNVSRSFIGSTRLNNAYGEINKLNYNQLYQHLTQRLSTSEARNYVRGVTKRREKYIKQ